MAIYKVRYSVSRQNPTTYAKGNATFTITSYNAIAKATNIEDIPIHLKKVFTGALVVITSIQVEPEINELLII